MIQEIKDFYKKHPRLIKAIVILSVLVDITIMLVGGSFLVSLLK